MCDHAISKIYDARGEEGAHRCVARHLEPVPAHERDHEGHGRLIALEAGLRVQTDTGGQCGDARSECNPQEHGTHTYSSRLSIQLPYSLLHAQPSKKTTIPW